MTDDPSNVNKSIKLTLTNGSSFVILFDRLTVHTCYTDATGTSRSSSCSPRILVDFCKEVIKRFTSKED